MMHNSNQGNRGIRNWEWSGVEQNRVEQSRIRIIRIKIKEKCDIIAKGVMCDSDSDSDWENRGSGCWE